MKFLGWSWVLLLFFGACWASNGVEEDAAVVPLQQESTEASEWSEKEFVLKYPFVFLSYDPENRPIWMSDWGGFDMEKIVLKGNRTMENFEKYLEDIVRIMKISMSLKLDSNKVLLLIDFKDFLVNPSINIQKLAFILKLLRDHKPDIEEHVAKVYIINANFASESFVSLVTQTVFHSGFKQRVQVLRDNVLPPWLKEAMEFRMQE